MSAQSQHSIAQRGALAATMSFLFWGIIPIYWKQLQAVPAFELIAHRIVWSLLFLLVVVAWQRAFAQLRPALTQLRTFSSALLSSALLAVNWTIYVWAVNTGHVIESSLGYFLTPLCNVGLGFVFLHERLRRLQWAAVALAAAGVALLLFYTGRIPWIALSLAGSWSLYGLLKKRSDLGSIAGLTFETLALFPVAAAFLSWQTHTGEGAIGHVDPWLHTLIIGTGIITTIPLLLFAYGARRLRLATLGVLQYIAPTVQFLIGLLLYHEPFDSARLQAFVLIWCGLVLYTADSFWSQRSRLWSTPETV
jgi:chloramphenicol-sensitive protein RarD